MIVAFEGIDGSGKGTQSYKLSARMSAKGIENSLYSFPNYNGTSFGHEVSKYLSGGFGSLESIAPEFPVMLYALDRFEMKKRIMDDIKYGHNIIFDRYIASNIAHQACKLKEVEQASFADWVKRLEYNILEMPKPDVVIFLDVPPPIASKMVENRNQQEKIYDKKDIHEVNKDYLNKVYEMYKKMAAEENWIVIQSTDGDNMRDENDIAKDILISLARYGYPVEEPKVF